LHEPEHVAVFLVGVRELPKGQCLHVDEAIRVGIGRKIHRLAFAAPHNAIAATYPTRIDPFISLRLLGFAWFTHLTAAQTTTAAARPNVPGLLTARHPLLAIDLRVAS
jgi:hypothetical protein